MLQSATNGRHRAAPHGTDARSLFRRSAGGPGPPSAFLLVGAALLVGIGCDRGGSDAPAIAPPAPPASRWTIDQDRVMVGVGDPALRRELEEASRQARRTAGDARRKWSTASPKERDRWAVKWAAPVLRTGADESASDSSRPPTEQVWVLPVSWNAWRIEGVLASTPRHRIGFACGDLVGFPADELADWIHTLDGPVDQAFDGAREGGFTVRVLERAFGPPLPGE